MDTSPGETLASRYRGIAREFAAELRRRLGTRVRGVWLYGSVARGVATEASDIDLLVEYADASPDCREVQRTLAAEFLDRYGALIGVLDCTPEQYRQLLRFPFGWELEKDAVAL